MDADAADLPLSSVAAVIADPARARMLCSLMDGRARTATELAVVAGIGASTASSHFQRLRDQGLVELAVQGKHRYYRLAGPQVAAALEALMVVAGGLPPRSPYQPSTPSALCHARTCYDHMAGTLAVTLHDALVDKAWLDPHTYLLTPAGEAAMADLGLDVAALRRRRRRFAHACLDWSERRPHLGGALGAALLDTVCQRGWMVKDLDSRALRVTSKGRARLGIIFGAQLEENPAM